MSIPFSNTTLQNGIMQIIERRLGFQPGDITGNPTLFAQFTAEVNLTVDEVLGFMYPLGGTWQLDDLNQNKYPIVFCTLESGRRDYQFDTDQDGNKILDIYRVGVKDTAGVIHEIFPVDQQTPNSENVNTDSFIDGKNLSGVPTRYDKTGNSIFLDPVPNYTISGGVLVFVNREGTYFTIADTTKVLGFALLYQEYFALKPAYKYAATHNMPIAGGRLRNGGFTGMLSEIMVLQDAIKTYYGNREKDVPGRIVANKKNNK